MIEKTVILPVSSIVTVELLTDSKTGIVSLGIRINGTQSCILASDVTVSVSASSPQPPWTTTIGNIFK
jgi:hypothetical protein